MAILSIVRGLGIAASFFTAGQLTHTSILAVPNTLSLAEDDKTDAQALAKQFLRSFQLEKLTQTPLEILSVAAFSFLAYQTRQSSPDISSWKLYVGAALSMLSVIPWTLMVMDQYSYKIVSLARPDASHANDTDAKLDHGQLGVPPSTQLPAITPVEEFEPYEDAPFSGAEYEKMKIGQLLKSWNSLNAYRVVCTAVAGACALAAVTTRVTLVTIVQAT